MLANFRNKPVNTPNKSTHSIPRNTFPCLPKGNVLSLMASRADISVCRLPPIHMRLVREEPEYRGSAAIV